MKTYSLKSENKPMLFSYDIDTEFQIIDIWVNDNKRYSNRDLSIETELLRNLAIDFIEIIESNKITEKQFDNLSKAIIKGPSGVWEKATSRLESFTFHFDSAKKYIKKFILENKSKSNERILNTISEAFSIDELLEVFTIAFNQKNSKVKIKSAYKILELREIRLTDFLINIQSKESNQKVINSIQFTIDNIHQPKGNLTF